MATPKMMIKRRLLNTIFKADAPAVISALVDQAPENVNDAAMMQARLESGEIRVETSRGTFTVPPGTVRFTRQPSLPEERERAREREDMQMRTWLECAVRR